MVTGGFNGKRVNASKFTTNLVLISIASPRLPWVNSLMHGGPGMKWWEKEDKKTKVTQQNHCKNG